LLCVFLAACAPSIKKVPAPVMTAPARAVAVTPAATSAQAASNATGVVSAKLEGQVASLKVTTTNLRDGMNSTLKEVERLRAAKTATEIELTGLAAMMNDSNKRAGELLIEVGTAQTTAQEQTLLRAKAEKEIGALVKAAAARDAETDTLRLQNKDLNDLVKAKSEEADGLRTSLTEADKAAAVGSYLKWVIGVMGLLLFLAAAGLIYLKFVLLPRG